MPAIGRNVAQPYNPSNFVIPNRLSMWFAPFDGQGRQTAFFELGDVSEIEIDLSEEFMEKKSARQGVLNTVKRSISDQEGAISFTLGEVVGRNLELLFRPSEIVQRDGDTNPMALVYERTRPRLLGTSAVEVAPGLAVEAGPGGTLYNSEITITEVSSVDGSIRYEEGVDYTFTQANEGEPAQASATVGGNTAVAGNSITLIENDGSSLELEVGEHFAAATSAAELRDNIVRAINTYSNSYVAEADGAAGILIANVRLDGAGAPDIVVAGTELIADLGGAAISFSTGVATSPATIARIATGGIPNGAEVAVTFSFNRRGVEYRIQSGLVLEGALRIQALSTAGPQAFYEFPRVSLEIDGAISLNPEEFMGASMTANILPDGNGVRGRYTQLCTYSDFFVEAAATACPAAPIAASE
jgi:hypothetical protein